ncbi:tyrosine-type recombinase/integrase [Enterococcus sp. HY326]|uniref:tyrosine-type recombinase/integrase n=1 Tax=Enterococcus sp. HY326 TaxID=2971265 RepID=UPI00223FF315|nr:tyrosine-type recombinase/integrase [Enterococcus sp. HY326]
MKDKLIHDVLANLNHEFNSEQLRKVKLVMTLILKKYDIAESKNELMVYDATGDTAAYQQYFISLKLKGLAEGSIKLYMRTINHFLATVKKSFDDVTTNDIRFYLANRELIDKVSKATIARERGSICRFFEWLHIEEFISKNIDNRVEKTKVPKRLKKAFTNYEIEMIRNATQTVKEKAVIELFLSTGCRVSELCSLQLGNYNRLQGSITVIGKGNKERTVFVNAKAKLAVENYLREVPHDLGPILLGKNQNKCSISGIQKIIKAIAYRVGIHAHPHKFRRTAATLAYKKDLDINKIRLFLGHEDLGTTQGYIDTSDTDLKVLHEKYFG